DKNCRLRFVEAKKGNRFYFGLDLANDLKPLARQIRRSKRQPGQIGIRTRKRWHEANRQRIGDDHDNRNGGRRLLCNLGHHRHARDQHVDGFVDELSDDRLRALAISVGKMRIEAEIAAFDVAELSEPLAQIFELILGGLRLPGHEASLENSALLRPRNQRQRYPAGNSTEKFPPPHSITPSS